MFLLKKQTQTLMRCNQKRLEQQCENEDLAKQILLFSKDRSKDEQNERRKFLNKRIEQRKNLYIYPEQVSV